MNKKLPYGKSNYKELVYKNYLYVDKTKYIEKLENLNDTFIFFLRPRRFGKSLFTSVLENYYDANKKDEFEVLFKDTYIGKNPTPEKNSYYILKFNFSGLITESEDALIKSFHDTCFKSYDKFLNNYNLNVKYDKTGYPSDVFNKFLNDVSFVIDKPLYVIIDEYDHFANELLSFKTDMFSDIVSKTGFVRKWYEVLKIGTESIIQRIFATGVTPITLDSLTSGFNISTDITRDVRFNKMMGFTEEEVRNLIKRTIQDEKKIEKIIKEMKINYNGYLFSEEGKKTVFNSDMVLYYLKNIEESGNPPKELIDKNIASDYAKLGSMFNLKNREDNYKVLEDILNGEEVTARITNQFSLEKRFSDEDFKSLLFYLGLLTIVGEDFGDAVLYTPNNVIRELYFDFYGERLREESDYNIDSVSIKNAMKDIAKNGNNQKLVEIVENTLKKLSNRDYITFNEKYVKLIFLTYCYLSKIYLVKSEYEVEDGYIDIALLKRVNMNPKYFGIIELKYISKSKYKEKGEEIVKEKLKEAKEQLEKYKLSKELSEIKNLKRWAIVFVNDKCYANEEI
ncbi:MAG: ATP-binding protein [Clostridium sp.]|nr:ATP-binding protein [Clostridium sp.]